MPLLVDEWICLLWICRVCKVNAMDGAEEKSLGKEPLRSLKMQRSAGSYLMLELCSYVDHPFPWH